MRVEQNTATVSTKATGITKGTPVEIAVDGRFLYGAPASNLELSGEVTLKEAKERAGSAAKGGPDEEGGDYLAALEARAHGDGGKEELQYERRGLCPARKRAGDDVHACAAIVPRAQQQRGSGDCAAA